MRSARNRERVARWQHFIGVDGDKGRRIDEENGTSVGRGRVISGKVRAIGSRESLSMMCGHYKKIKKLKTRTRKAVIYSGQKS